MGTNQKVNEIACGRGFPLTERLRTPFDCGDDIGHRDFGGTAGELVAPDRTTGTKNQSRRFELEKDLDQIGSGIL